MRVCAGESCVRVVCVCVRVSRVRGWCVCVYMHVYRWGEWCVCVLCMYMTKKFVLKCWNQ